MQQKILLVLAIVVAALAWREKIDPDLYERLQAPGAKETVWVDIKGDGSLDALTQNGRRNGPWEVYLALKKQQEETQGEVIEFLDAHGLDYQSFWIKNTIEVFDVCERLVEELAERFDVEKIRPDIDMAVTPVQVDITPRPRPTQVGWNIEIVNAPALWEAGITGEGITVANIDTGVRYTHEALVETYRGSLGGDQFDHNYNWFDPAGGAEPFDGNGHGTHTIGSSNGDAKSGIGVAPGAKWIAARGCRSSACSESDLLGSAQFLLCPTDVNGENEDCDRAPQVINNSWGGGQGNTWYYDAVAAWRAAGIIPVFSQGNSGSRCGSANSPADYDNVIGVGATNRQDVLASFSSRGPGVSGQLIERQKPQISAPGVAVNSASNGGDSSYTLLSGTSMAGPHVAGAVALYLQKNPTATYDDIFAALTESADQDLPRPEGSATECDGVSYQEYPNFFYGYGRLNAEKFVSIKPRRR